MSLKVKNIFENTTLIVIFNLNIISLVFGMCYLRLPEDDSLRPNIALKLGSHQVHLTLNKAGTVSFFENQEIEATCDTKFEYPENINKETKINLKCNSNLLQVYDSYLVFSQDLFQCSSQKWNLYETTQNFRWCPSNTISYLLARPVDSDTTPFQYLAGVCYDTGTLSFKSLYYTIATQHSEHLHPKALTYFYKPSLELKYFNQVFGNKSITETDYDNQDIKDWIKYCQYNYSSIIQNKLLLNEFNIQLGALLDLAWWPNLRLGNWKRYETALTRQVESQHQSYDIMAGVSAVAAVPIIESCQTNYTLKELVDKNNNKIPLYVWNYLTSVNNSSEEIVIIGFNSPFYEFYSEKDVVFCSDKCQKIPWLKKVSSTFRYSAMGIIFCCSSEDVKSSKRLDGFPEVNMNSQALKTVTVQPTDFLFG